MAFLSLSIDLAGSTRIKQEMVTIAQEDRARLETLYERFANVLYLLERGLYQAMIACRHARLDRLYLVKSVGDEYWYAYDLPEDAREAAAVTTEILTVLKEITAQERVLNLALPNAIGEDTTRLDDVSLFDIPLKIFVDVIDGALEVNSARYEHLKDLVLQATGQRKGPTYAVDNDFVEVCRRLNMGEAGMIVGKGRGISVRADYIGLEVDRFFRLAKCCHAGLIGVGGGLLERLPHRIANVSSDLDYLAIKRFATASGGGLSCFIRFFHSSGV